MNPRRLPFPAAAMVCLYVAALLGPAVCVAVAGLAGYGGCRVGAAALRGVRR